jgi:hypothetical protein
MVNLFAQSVSPVTLSVYAPLAVVLHAALVHTRPVGHQLRIGDLSYEVRMS